MASGKQSLYEILGVSGDATPIDIGLAYDRRRAEAAKRVPPDANDIALVQQAYEVLSNPKRRAAYDASLVTAAEKAQAVEQPPDLLLEPEEKPTPRKPIWVGVFAGAVALTAALYFSFQPGKPKPDAAKEAPAPPKAVVQAPPPPPQPLTAATILAGVAPSIGLVMSYDMSGQAKPLGLAVAVDRGVFVTTCHGIPAGSALVVRIGKESHSATLSTQDEQLDLCKLTVPDVRTGGIAAAPEELKAGDKVHVLGANTVGEIAMTEAKVKQLRPVPAGSKVIELDVPIAPNGSGGAVIDVYGRLVGVATTPHAFGSGINIALPAAWLTDMRSRTRPQ